METIVLILLLIFALMMCGLVLLQRSEGGGLGIGGGGGGMGGRPKANPLAQLTWYIAVAFMVCALALTVIAARDAANDAIINLIDEDAAADGEPLLDGDSLLPPSADEDALVPPASDEN